MKKSGPRYRSLDDPWQPEFETAKLHLGLRSFNIRDHSTGDKWWCFCTHIDIRDLYDRAKESGEAVMMDDRCTLSLHRRPDLRYWTLNVVSRPDTVLNVVVSDHGLSTLEYDPDSYPGA